MPKGRKKKKEVEGSQRKGESTSEEAKEVEETETATAKSSEVPKKASRGRPKQVVEAETPTRKSPEGSLPSKTSSGRGKVCGRSQEKAPPEPAPIEHAPGSEEREESARQELAVSRPSPRRSPRKQQAPKRVSHGPRKNLGLGAKNLGKVAVSTIFWVVNLAKQCIQRH